MENFSTNLTDRILCYDGDVIATKKYLYNKLLKGESLVDCFVTEIDTEIKSYNQHNHKKLTIKNSVKPLDLSWNIPDNYKTLSLRTYILSSLEKELSVKTFTFDQIEKRINRTELELKLWEDHELNDLLRTLIYIVDQFTANSIVWGTGRGSSCCCYILYLIKLHDVDSVLYNLDIKEFFRD